MMDYREFLVRLCGELDFRAPNARQSGAREAIQSIKHAIEDVLNGVQLDVTSGKKIRDRTQQD